MKSISRSTFISLILLVSSLCWFPSLVFSTTEIDEVVYEYNFPEGVYQILKYSSSEEFDYNVLHEGDIPSSKQYYNSSSDGFLEITIEPINGISPYLELECNQTWESLGYVYSLKVYEGDSIGLIITPNMRLNNSEITRIGEGSYSIFDTWVWPDTSGNIYMNFTPAESIVYDFDWAPIIPEEDQEITFYSLSNPYANYSWTVDNKKVQSNSSVLELDGLSSGEHFVVLQVDDEFGNSFIVSKTLSVKPSLIVIKPVVLDVFNLEYPELIETGTPLKITVHLDYILPVEKSIQLKVSEPNTGVQKSVATDSLMGNGTKKFELYIQAPHEVGILEYYLEYSVFEDSWTEFYPASIIQFEVTEPEESNRKIPSYPVLAIFLGVFVFIKLHNNLKLAPR